MKPLLALLLTAAVAVALPWPTPPSDHKTVDTAATTTIQPASATTFGATGYLGLTVKRDAAGRPQVDLVQPDSPAAVAGIKAGDVVLRVGDRPTPTPDAFREWVQASPGSPVKVVVERDKQPLTVTAKPATTSRPMRLAGFGGAPRPFLGVRLGEFTENEGVKVEEVTANSPGEAAGVKVGDFLFKLNGEPATRGDVLRALVEEKKVGDKVEMVLRRAGKEVPVTATLAAERQRGGGGGGGFTIQLWKKPVLKLGIVGIEFSDIKHNAATTTADLETRFVQQKAGGTGLADYVHDVSAGALKVEGKAVEWVEVAKKRGDYVQGSGVSNKTAVLKDALEKLTARDGKESLNDFDVLLFVYAGELVRSNAGAVYTPHAGTIEHQGKRFAYFLGPEGGANPATINPFVKPMWLALGLPDLAARTENQGSEGLGPWCALSDVSRTSRPQHLSAWAKEKLGWLKPAVIDPATPQKLVLSPVEGSNKECFKILVRPDGSEYLLLEVRSKKGFDGDLPGEGLLIWRVVNDRPLLQESHGVEAPNGPTIHLAAVPYPTAANTAYTPLTVPSSRSPLGGGLPVHLTGIRKLPDGKVAFQVGFEYD